MKLKGISQTNDSSVTKNASGQDTVGAKGKAHGHPISVPASSQNPKNLREVIEGASQSPGLARAVAGVEKGARSGGGETGENMKREGR